MPAESSASGKVPPPVPKSLEDLLKEVTMAYIKDLREQLNTIEARVDAVRVDGHAVPSSISHVHNLVGAHIVKAQGLSTILTDAERSNKNLNDLRGRLSGDCMSISHLALWQLIDHGPLLLWLYSAQTAAIKLAQIIDQWKYLIQYQCRCVSTKMSRLLAIWVPLQALVCSTPFLPAAQASNLIVSED